MPSGGASSIRCFWLTRTLLLCAPCPCEGAGVAYRHKRVSDLTWGALRTSVAPRDRMVLQPSHARQVLSAAFPSSWSPAGFLCEPWGGRKRKAVAEPMSLSPGPSSLAECLAWQGRLWSALLAAGEAADARRLRLAR
eukprot:5357445-Alexandrium_andersonii.AAC.1